MFVWNTIILFHSIIYTWKNKLILGKPICFFSWCWSSLAKSSFLSSATLLPSVASVVFIANSPDKRYAIKVTHTNKPQLHASRLSIQWFLLKRQLETFWTRATHYFLAVWTHNNNHLWRISWLGVCCHVYLVQCGATGVTSLLNYVLSVSSAPPKKRRPSSKIMKGLDLSRSISGV